MTYKHAPITEAVIEIGVASPEIGALENVERVRAALKSGYPISDDAFAGTIALDLGEAPDAKPSASINRQRVGHLLRNEIRDRVVSITINKFAFSRLPLYTRWEEFRDEARAAWSSYREHVKPSSTTRLAVRYINRIDLPGVPVEIKDYVRTYPEISPVLPQTFSGFAMQIHLPQPDIEAMLILNQGLVPSPLEGLPAIMLDIDLFRVSNVPQEENEIWEYFERLRERKNQIFEACVTDKSREIFDK